jgi:dTDP-4-amino-4,6-dideoxygalactose transaminase
VSDRRNESGTAHRLPIAAPTLPAFETILPRLRDIWNSGALTNGNTVAEFEAAIAARLPGRQVVAVNSCTSGLMLALRAMEVRGEVLLPSFTFTATAHAVVWNGCTPVWVDCDPNTFNVDIDDLQRKITSKTQAIVGVYVSGNPPRVAELEAIARRHGLKLILDAAHALGSTVGGTPAGCFGDAEVFSLSPTKTITTCEGGIVSVRDPEVARRLRIGRNYANPGNYDSEFVGLNARMSELHALVGLASLPALDANIAERQRLVAAYEERLQRLPGIRLQQVAGGDVSACKDFSVRIVASAFGADRDTVRNALTDAGIETRTYFDPPVHRQTAYRAWRLGSGGLPNTETVAAEVLNLPLFVGLTDLDVERVVQSIRDVQRGAKERVKKPAHAAV